jgi:hypothetical protein
MDLNINEVDSDIILNSESRLKKRNNENGLIVDSLNKQPVKTDEEIIDSNLEPVIKTEISDFDFTEKYDLPQIIGEKRKNNEITEIEPKKVKEELVVFEECSDDQIKTEPTDEETHNKVFKY